MTILRSLSSFSLISLLAALFASGHAEAQISDPASYSVSRLIEATVRPSFLVDRLVTVDILTRNDETAKQIAEHTVEVNEYFVDLSILEAFTLKAEGRRIAVRPESIVKREKPITFRGYDSFDLDVKVTTIFSRDGSRRPDMAGQIYRQAPQHSWRDIRCVSGGAKIGQWSGGAVLPRGGVITGHWLG